MKLLDRYEFTNGKAFETFYLEAIDQQRMRLPECDVIAVGCVGDNTSRIEAMRPDEALILARLLIDAVQQVTEGYSIAEPVVYEQFSGERRVRQVDVGD